MAKRLVYLSVEDGIVDIIVNKNIKKNPIVEITWNPETSSSDDVVSWFMEHGVSAGKAMVYVIGKYESDALRSYLNDVLEFVNLPDDLDIFSVLEFYSILMNRQIVPFSSELSVSSAMNYFGITSRGAAAVKELHEKCLALLTNEIVESE